MCCCEKPTINGQPGYRWQPNDVPHVRPVHPPDLGEGDELLIDSPGRCGGLDCHSHHYRLVVKHGQLALLVRHGGGDERIRLHNPSSRVLADGTKEKGIPLAHVLVAMDSNARYWTFHALYYAHSDAQRDGRFKEHERWKRAAIDKRIKVHRRHGPNYGRVEITPELSPGAEFARRIPDTR